MRGKVGEGGRENEEKEMEEECEEERGHWKSKVDEISQSFNDVEVPLHFQGTALEAQEDIIQTSVGLSGQEIFEANILESN